MQEIRKMPIGVQDFEKLILGGYVYVDKTKFVYQLAQGNCYFLSRPRRFGKSLLLSTLKQYFLGNKDVFKGLAIEKLENENPTSFDKVAWVKHPVIYIDLNSQKYEDKDSLKRILDFQLSTYEKNYSTEKPGEDFGVRFANLIREAYKITGRQTVVLVDEYDKPLLQTIDKPELFDDYRATLKAFYGVLKSEDASLRFSMLTGVTKFSQVSVWSDLNNLQDITMDPFYSSVCGISEEELHANLNAEVENLAATNKISVDECYSFLKAKYDGYHFCEDTEGIYNPFSLLNTLQSTKMRDYWFQTGTPTFLVQEIKRNNYDLRKLIDGVDVDSQRLTEYSVGGTNPIPILVQSGYLTIKGYDKEFDTYHLELPNEEVKYGFLNFLSPDFIGTKSFSFDSDFDVRKFVKDIRSANVDAFMTRLQSIIASLPYPTDAKNQTLEMLEYNFQVAVYLTFTLMGQFTQCEVHSIKGRADSVVETQDAVYIFEFKTNDSAENALAQIDELGYADKYSTCGKRIVKIGAEFNSEERKLVKWVRN